MQRARAISFTRRRHLRARAVVRSGYRGEGVRHATGSAEPHVVAMADPQASVERTCGGFTADCVFQPRRVAGRLTKGYRPIHRPSHDLRRKQTSTQAWRCDSPQTSGERRLQNALQIVPPIAVTRAAQLHSQLTRHVTCQRHASRGVNDPLDSGAGPPRARGTGVVHTTACCPSPTPWRADGRHKAPPDRGDAADKCLSGFAIGALACARH
jgi:hypothetical protein